MTSFWGFLSEGILLLVLALWWMINTSREVIKCEQNGATFNPKITYTWRGTHVPVEIFYKLFITAFGLFGQLFYSSWSFHDDKGDFQNMVPLMFITVYGIFFLHSILDLLLWLRVPVFKGANYASAATGFLWYAVAYYFSVDDFKATNPPLMVSVMLWTFPMYVLLPIAASFALEPLWRSGVGTQFVRAFCLQLYATWCWHCALILHERGVFPGSGPNPAWIQDDHRNISFTAAIFGFHICINVVFACATYSLVALYVRMRHGFKVNNNSDLSRSYGYTALTSEDKAGATLTLKQGADAKLLSAFGSS
ncbi:transmembrane protein 45B-like [Pomacea canaliculata]|nr:transmembrane protein 45B-like [Pomacea canaliculata]XP_025091147.1 transmembrane protein 45B-like [Pomacea canaliculata]